MTRLAAMAGLMALAVPQFTTSVNQVEIYASVTDDTGRPVEGLTAADFVVTEDGVAQQISVFAEGNFPLAAAVAVDASFSMAGERLAVAKSAARLFLGELQPADQAMLMAIVGTADVIAPLSTDRAAQFRALDGLSVWGTTSLHDAVIDAIGELQPANGRRALVLLSDGDDRYSEASAEDVLALARRSDVMIYPVALGRAMPPLFSDLAELSGGRAYHQRDARELPATLRAIAAELRRQYLIGYTPTRPFTATGRAWRDIEVRARGDGLTVRARDGYYSGNPRTPNPRTP
ncbi:MAG TPA: VWA domain-containing protein [Vicinamibacterales bacterium]|nr:VWA domain-containing protein [Vicinamibacterales bacterium]